MRPLVYGVTGYTGRLVSRELARLGVAHIVGGRRADAVDAWAHEVSCEARAFALDAPDLSGVSVVLNCAGPFAVTSVPLATAAIAAGAHYLDLAGEVAEHEAVRALGPRARERGVMVMPGVGFGVVPTECAAALAARGVERPTELVIAYETRGGASRGTLEVVLGGLRAPGVARRGGQLVPSAFAEEVIALDLGGGAVKVATNPHRADQVAAFASTGIPDISTYATFPAMLRWLMRSRLRDTRMVSRMFDRALRKAPEGPSPAERAKGKTRVIAIAKNASARCEVRVAGPEAYDFTARTAAAAVTKIDRAKPGYQTPSQAYGTEWFSELLTGPGEGVEVIR